MALTTPPTADDISKRTAAADALPTSPAANSGVGNFPGLGFLTDQFTQAGLQARKGNLAGAAGGVAAGLGGFIPAAVGESVYHVGKAIGDIGSRFFGGANDAPAATDSPPARAASAAGDAAKAAFGMNDRGAGYDASRPGPAYTRAADNGDVSGWNNMVAALSNVNGMSPDQAGAVLKQPLPQWGKMGPEGGGTTNFDTTNGAARRVNAGYGTQIVARGATQVRDTGDGQLHTRNNDFSGIGVGGLPGGSAAVFGPNSAPSGAAQGGEGASPLSTAHAHIMDLMSQAEQKRAAGDGLGAKSLENHAARMAAIFQGLSEHMYKTGLLHNQERETTLREHIAKPGVEVGNMVADRLANGDTTNASNIRAADKGDALYGVSPVLPGYPYMNPRTGQPYTYPQLNTK